MKHKFLITLIILFTGFVGVAQTEDTKKESKDSIKVKRLSIGFKLGIPNLASGSAELVLPVLKQSFCSLC